MIQFSTLFRFLEAKNASLSVFLKIRQQGTSTFLGVSNAADTSVVESRVVLLLAIFTALFIMQLLRIFNIGFETTAAAGEKSDIEIQLCLVVP